MGDTGKKVGSGVGTVGGAVVGGYFGGPAGAMIGAGVGGALGGIAGGLFDSADAPEYTPPVVDPANYQYGGSADAYDRAMAQYKSQTNRYQDRAAPELNWDQSNNDYTDAQHARSLQMSEGDRLRLILEGKGGPSLAELQMQRGLATNTAMAQQLAASARGGAGAQMLATRDAGRQAALGGLAVNRDAGIARLQEQQMAGQQYQGLLGTMRGQDYTARAGSLGQQGLVSQNELATRGQNDAMTQAYLSAQTQAMQGRTNAGIALGNAQLGAQTSVQQINATADAAAKQRSDALLGGMVSTGGSVAAAGLSAYGAQQKDAQQKAAAGSTGATAPGAGGGVFWPATNGGPGSGVTGPTVPPPEADPTLAGTGAGGSGGTIQAPPTGGAGVGDGGGTPYGYGGGLAGDGTGSPYDPNDHHHY